MGQKKHILVLYAREDKAMKLPLLRHLNSFAKEFNLVIWHEHAINPKHTEETYFESRIQHSDIVLLMVSNTFMDSKFIRKSEFKTVIDRHKETTSVVIPVLFESCNWNVDLKFIDYIFNLSELQVLPTGEKPISDWDEAEEAYDSVAASLRNIIESMPQSLNPDESAVDKEVKVTDTEEEQQIALSFKEEDKVGKMREEAIPEKEEMTEEEEHKRWMEAETKRRAEVAKMIREQAEASARRREEEDKLWEEAMAKRRAEKEKRILEGAASAHRGEERKSYTAETESGNRAEEKQRAQAKAEAKRKAAREKRIREKSEAKRKAEQENIRKQVAEARRFAEEEKRLKQVAENYEEDNEPQNRKYPVISKKVYTGAGIALVIIIGIWAFSLFNSETENTSATLPEVVTIDKKDANGAAATVETKTDSSNKAVSLPELEVGEMYEGGIVFTIDPSGKTGKIAHIDDAGPMPWQTAIKIHELLGEGWRLPTFDELVLMHKTIGQGATNSGEFAGGLYWSATAFDEFQARLLRFRDGNTSYHYNKHVEGRSFKVRAIRDFSR